MSVCSSRVYIPLIFVVILSLVHFGFVFYSTAAKKSQVEVISVVEQMEITLPTSQTVDFIPASLRAEITDEHRDLNVASTSEGNTDTLNFTVTVRRNLSDEHESIIEKQRLMIKGEMSNYDLRNRTLESFIMETGGEPLRTIVVTKWRSGSNFLGSILEQNSGTFFYSEPLAHFGWVEFRNGTDSDMAIREVQDLLNCDYSNLDGYMQFAVENASWVFDLNSRLGQHCQKSARKRICSNTSFLSRFCKLFPFQAAKLVRMRLTLARTLLEDSKNIRVLYLVRDPRGSLQSRRRSLNSQFCIGNAFCTSTEILCSSLEDDYESAREFVKDFPDRFMAVRYEDLALNPLEMVKLIYEFSHWDFNSRIEKYVKEHTTKSAEGDFATYRESDEVVFRWRERLNWTEVSEIQRQCSKAITNWGYKVATSNDDLKNFQPLGELNLLEDTLNER